ncbi:MAG: PAS domain S-box protein [Gammaproteobacteria bacterium]
MPELLARAAARALGASASLFSIVHPDRHQTTGAFGLSTELCRALTTTVSDPLYARLSASGESFLAEDTRQHPTAPECTALLECGFRSCLAVPYKSADGRLQGMLCVIDDRPRGWPERGAEVLRDLAALAISGVERQPADGMPEEILATPAAGRVETMAVPEARIAEAGETEVMLRALAEHAADAFLVHDEAGRLTEVNRAACDCLGYTRGELLAMSVQDLDAGEAAAGKGGEDWACLQPGQGMSGRALYRRKNGTTVSMDMRRSCCRLHGQRRFLLLAHDRTQRLTAEEGLRQQAMLIHLAHDPIFVWDETNGIVFWNQGSERLYGYSKEEAVGRASHVLLKTVFPDTREQLQAELDRHGKWSGELRQYTRSGRQVIVSSRVQKVTIGGRTLMLEANRDITALRRAMEQLASSERRFHELVQIAPVGVFETDASGDCLYVNQRWCDITGMSPEHAQGKGWTSALYPEDRDRLSAQWYRAVAGRTPFQAEYRYQRPDGEVRWALCSGIPQHAPDGRLTGFMGTVTDISDNKDVEMELRRSREQLRTLLGRLDEAVEAERRHLAREVHDQLGQSLTALKLDASWAAQRLGGGDETARAAVIDKLRGMTALIDTTVDSVQRISAQLRPQMLEDMGLVPALEVYAEQFAERTGIRCRVHASEIAALPGGEATHVFRIVQEAMTNVARHARATRVDVSLVEVDGVLRVDIQDDGRGIAESEPNSASALGMLGMRERARLLAGHLTVTGIPGRGTVVSVEMPVDADSAAI